MLNKSCRFEKNTIMTILDFFKSFYEENSQHNNIKMMDEKLVITEDNKRPFGNKIIFSSKTFLLISDWGGKKEKFDVREFTEVETKPRSIWSFNGPSMMRKGDYILNNTKIGSYGGNLKEIEGLLKSFKTKLKTHKENGILFGDDLEKIQEDKRLKEFRIQEDIRIQEENKKEEKRLKNLNESKSELISEFDKDGNGLVDITEGNDFNLLLKKHQKQVVEIDRTYVQKFVKVSSYLKTKQTNVQLIFNSIKDTTNQQELRDYLGILKNEIHSYNLILFNSLNMIVSLVEDDMITFYEIHDSFDKLNMFNSNWESDVSLKLSNIGSGLNNLMYSIQEMGENIVNEISDLTYVTEESNRILSDELKEIGSSMKTNNFLTAIQTYQMYKINKNTKRIN